MGLQSYEVDIAWEPDPQYINWPPDYEYLAWRLGTNPVKGTALWAINQVVETPTFPITDLLPDGYVALEVNDDTYKYGYSRNMLPSESIDSVEDSINLQTTDTQLELA